MRVKTARELTASPSGSLTARRGPIGLGRADHRCRRARNAGVSASYNAAVAAKVMPPNGVLLKLLQDYQASDHFRSRRDRTRHDYVQQIKRIERDLGDFPLRHSPTAAPVECSWSGATSWR